MSKVILMRRSQLICSSGKQAGYILIVSVMLLLIVTLVTIAMGRGFFAEEGMAGNMRESVRAFTAAQSALRVAETILSQQNTNGGVTCNAGTLTGSIGFTICNNQVVINPFNQAPNTGALANQPPTFSTYTIYSAFPGTISATGGQDTYYAAPVYYIYYVGTTTTKLTGGMQMLSQLYQVTAAGYGGNQNAVAIVRSNYVVSSTVQCKTAQC